MYTETDTTRLREMKDLNQCKICELRVGRLSVKKSVLPKFIYEFSSVPIKVPEGVLVEIDRLILKFI